jgi:putative ABC transport system permease protein
MSVLFRIALRNILEHKSKSFIIGAIIALGVVIIVVGNSLMDSAEAGIERSFIANYTGQVMVTGIAKGTISLFGVQSPGTREETPVIPEFDALREKFAQDPQVRGFSPLVTGFSSLSVESDSADSADTSDDSAMGKFTLLFGIEAEGYHKLFDNMKLVSGRYLRNGEEGILITRKRADSLKKSYKRDFVVGTKILLNGFGVNGMKIRELPIVGIFDWKQENGGTDFISYVDVQTLRALNGMTVGSGDEVKLAPSQTALLAATDTDSLFGGDMVDTGVKPGAAITERSIGTLLGDKAANAASRPAIDTGAWHYILLRLKPGVSVPRYIASLNLWFAREGIQARAGDWQAAAGPYGQAIDVVRVVFDVAILIVAIVAIIIMMNTLIISVIERTSEIGTMRALGAQKSFVWRMFLTETLTLTIVFGLVGMVLAGTVVGILNVIGIKASSSFLEILFGGKVLRPVIQAGSLIWTLVMVTVVGFLAHLYPVAVAMRIPPVRAIQTE